MVPVLGQYRVFVSIAPWVLILVGLGCVDKFSLGGAGEQSKSPLASGGSLDGQTFGDCSFPELKFEPDEPAEMPAELCEFLPPTGTLRPVYKHPTTGAFGHPGFSITFEDGVSVGSNEVFNNQNSYSVTHERVTVVVTDMGNFEWQLRVVNKGPRKITGVAFPLDQAQVAVGATITDDIVYFTYLNGVAWLASTVGPFNWAGYDYPSPSIAPLVVVADSSSARITAAINWPPRRVFTYYAYNKTMQHYTVELAPGSDSTFRALIAQVDGSSAPWQEVVDLYRAWLLKKMYSAGLYPLDYPDWMKKSHGFRSYSVMNSFVFAEEGMKADFERWSKYEGEDLFPWYLIWGQMSNYVGDPTIAVPPLLPGEKVGCCLAGYEPHPRYVPGLINFAKWMQEKGGRIGYYTRPWDYGGDFKYGKFDNPTDLGGCITYLRQFLHWLEVNAQLLHATTHYIDVLGAGDFGDPLTVARILRQKIKAPHVIEFAHDVYPSANLTSGSLNGGDYKTKPHHDISQLGTVVDGKFLTGITYPEFGRYLLRDRIQFLGGSNGDHVFWNGPANYEAERRAFLMGTKLEAMNPEEFDSYNLPQPVISEGVKQVVTAWRQSKFWDYEAVYLHQRGISNIPNGVRVRRFRDKACTTELFAVDNWNQLEGTSFTFNGTTISIPTQKLSILKVPIESGAPTAGN